MKCMNPEETEEVVISGSLNDVTSSGMSTESRNMGPRELLGSKRNNPHTQVQVESGLVMTHCLKTQDKCVIEQ